MFRPEEEAAFSLPRRRGRSCSGLGCLRQKSSQLLWLLPGKRQHHQERRTVPYPQGQGLLLSGRRLCPGQRAPD